MVDRRKAISPKTKRIKQLKERKAKVLDLMTKDLSVNEIARAVDLAPSTVCKYIDEWKILLPEIDKVDQWNISKGSILDAATSSMLKKVLERSDDPKASVNNLAYALQQVHNIKRLEKGESTQNVAHAHYVDADITKHRLK